MRILQVTPAFFSDQSYVGGGERYVHNLCVAVTKATPSGAVRCDMLSLAPAQKVVSLGPCSDLHLIPGVAFDMVACAGGALDDLIDRYDVIHVHQCLTSWGLFVASRARLASKTVLGTDHGGGESALLDTTPRLAAVYDAFHAQSDFAASAFLTLSRPVHVILGPVDESSIPLSRAKREAGHVVALGRILQHKGFEHTIEALPEGMKLTIIGRAYDGDYANFLRQRAGNKDVRIETELDNQAVTDMLGRASLYVHSGTHFGYKGHYYAKPELLALAPIEAMCAGTPAIVSSAGAMPGLGALPACRVYKDTEELASLIKAHMVGQLFQMSPEDIREAAVARYGLAQFGAAYLRMVADTHQKRC